MHADRDLLVAFTLVLGAAAVVTFLARLARQPVVLGYLIAGFLIGPHVPFPIVVDPEIVHTLSELGVILLMFFLGLEFSLGKLVRVGPSVSVTAVVQCSLLFWLGFAVGRAFGWTTLESLFTGAIIAISSTTIIAKAFDEQRITGRLRDLVVGVLIVEDLIAILLMALLTALATGAGVSSGSMLRTVARLVGFLLALVSLGLLVVPRAIRALVRRRRPEMLTVSIVGFCFGVSLLAREAGYSVALGAFLAGSLVAESGETSIERVVRPLRDVFGAVFFVSVGMMMDPSLIAQHWLPVLVITLVVIVGKVASVSFGAFLTGNGSRTSLQAGMSLAQIGEFSFIIAGLGISLNATGHFLFPVAVAVSSITTLLTPWLIRASGPVAEWVDRKLPRPLQTFGALYGSWLERIRSNEGSSETLKAARRLVRLLLLDGFLLAAVLVGTAVGAPSIRRFLVRSFAVDTDVAGGALAVALALACAPFVLGIARVSGRIAARLANAAIPPAGEGVDLAAPPRRALRISLQLVALLLVGVPIMAVTQPFLESFRAAELLLLVTLVLVIAVWRTAANLHGHVRAGAQVVIEALSQAKPAQANAEHVVPLRMVFAGLGDPVAIELPPSSHAVGRTLGELNVRGRTGATVLAITRGEEAIVMPSSRETLRAGDRLAIAGTREALAAARALLEAAEADAQSMANVLSSAAGA